MTNDRIWTLVIRKLSGEATPSELMEIEILIDENPMLKQNVFAAEEFWKQHADPDAEYLEATYFLHLDRLKEKGIFIEEHNTNQDIITLPSQNKNTLTGLLISLIFFCALGLTGWFIQKKQTASAAFIPAKPETEIVARYGARSKVLLPDGSNVWLNSGSKITYSGDFKTGLRDVVLTGEAYFDVVRNEKRPFTIHTPTMAVRVLGTQFNVKAYANDKTTETSLIHGSVLVTMNQDTTQKFLLKPNEKLVLQNILAREMQKENGAANLLPANSDVPAIKKLSYIKNTSVEVETSWTKNILSFNDEAFSTVANKMERWYDVTIRFENEKWLNAYLTGSFEQETLQQALAGLSYSTGFHYRIDGQTIIIY